MDQNTLLARLTMVSGEVVESGEVLAMVEMFGYSLVDPDLQKFSYKNDDHGTSDIRVLREGTMIELWGTHEEDAFTLSALAQKLGWEVADIEILDRTMEQHLIQNFTHLKLREVVSEGPGGHEETGTPTTSTAPVHAREEDASSAASPAAPLPTTENSAMESLREENTRLRSEIEALVRAAPAAAQRTSTSTHPDIDLINVLMEASIDLKDNPVVMKLAEHGFKVRIIAERGV